ncbi:hypothetical protein PG988_012725 [Apiospora saccharicola]
MSPENMIPRAYTGLKPGHIRLLYPDIRASGEDRWFLKVAQLLDNLGQPTPLEYDALSYTWGEDQVTSFAVNCNGQELRVHHNLNDALPFLARRDSQLPIWIDAVCINQFDDDEQKVQICHDVENIRRRFYCLERAYEIDITGKGHEIASWLSSDEAWSTFYDLVDNPWYRRLWVFQEVALAKRIRVLLGPHEVVWETLRYLVMHSKSKSFGRRPRQHKISDHVFQVRQERRETLASGNFTVRNLCNVLLSTAGTACREPADRVWALTGFINLEVPSSALIVDIRCPDFHDVKGRTSLPGRISKWEILMGSRERTFHASRRESKPKTQQNMHDNQLVLCGQIFDQIEETYPHWGSTNFESDERMQGFHSWEESLASAILNRAKRHEKPGPYNNTQKSSKLQVTTDDYWSTIRGGYATDGGVSPMSWEAFTCAKSQFENLTLLSESAFALSQILNVHDIGQHSPELRRYVLAAFGISMVQHERRCFSTARGRLGFGSSNIAVGDSVCIFSFATTAHIIRRTPNLNSETYALVGEAYIHGMMHGEIESLDIEEQEIVLV